VGHLVQTPCRSRVTYSRLHRTLSRQVLNISREGDSTTSLGSLFQCSVTFRVKYDIIIYWHTIKRCIIMNIIFLFYIFEITYVHSLDLQLP